MKISAIVAAAENNAIGKGNEMLWKLPNDFRFFKDTTWGLPIIMGRNTYNSLGKALAGRTNIVLTHREDWKPADAIVVNDLENAVEEAKKTNVKETYIIGGAQVYKQSLHLVTKVLLTRVMAVFPDADAFFPELPAAEWKLTASLPFKADEKNEYDYTFETWERIQNSKFKI